MNGYLSPKTLQLVGLILLVAAAGFWGATGRESVLIMGAAMSLIGLGAYKGTADAIFDNSSNKQKKLDDKSGDEDEA